MTPSGQGGGIFPLPMVEVPRPCLSSSRRLQQRARRAAVQTGLANSAIQALNSMYVSSSSSVSLQTRNTTDPITKPTQRAVAHIQLCTRRYVSRLAPSFGAVQRDDFDFLRDPNGLNTAAYAFSSQSLPLTAESVALPAQPATVDLVDVLPPPLAALYSKPNPELFRPADEIKPAASACLVKSPADYALLLRRMVALDMLSFTTEPKCVNGLFGTPKSDGAMRLVVDARPANALWSPSPKIELPSPELLSRLLVPQGETVLAAKADLDNYYHRIRLPGWMVPYFAPSNSRARSWPGTPVQSWCPGLSLLYHPSDGLVPFGLLGPEGSRTSNRVALKV